MQLNPRYDNYLYHVTRIDNIYNIVRQGLKTRSSLNSVKDKFGDTANHEILEKRKKQA